MDAIDGVLPYLTTVKHLRPISIKKYMTYLRVIFDSFGAQEPSQELVERFFFDQSTRNKNTVNTYLTAWRHYVNYLSYKNITHSLKAIPFYKKEKRIINVLTPEELDEIFAVRVKPRLYKGHLTTHYDFVIMTIIRFIALTGCRIEEALSLNWKDVNLAKNECWFRFTKTGVPRKAFIPSSLAERMVKLYDENNYVFRGMAGTKIAQGQFYFELQRVVKETSIKKHVNPHLFRHSLATQLLQEGVDISIVARILGHANVQQTYSTYAHLSDNTLRDEIIKHPSIQKDLAPEFLIEKIKEQIRKLRLSQDSRFIYKLSEAKHSIELILAIK